MARHLFRAALLSLCGLAACAPQTGFLCESDAQCDPGDVCSEGQCAQALTQANVIEVAPAAQTVQATVGTAPANAKVKYTNDASTNHNLVISCTGGAKPVDETLTIAPNATVTEEVALAAPKTTGSTEVVCTIESTTGKTIWATYSILVVATGSSSGGGSGGGTGGGSGGGSGGSSGAIGPMGGTVDLLDFVMTGDTRPPTCDDNADYPTAVHTQIVAAMAKLNPQLGLDLGDHMYVCSKSLANAQLQMGNYLSGLKGFPTYFAMTMGNHECENGADCSASSTDVNYLTFLSALKQVSLQTNPNYALQIETRLGRATLLVVADNSFSTADGQWLQKTLSDADANSKYTIVAKHHPVTGSKAGPVAPWNIISQHKISLLLMAHNHDYEHSGASVTSDGRGVICGLGGANLSHVGFCRVQQASDGTLRFTQYDLSGNPADTWSVSARD